MAIHDVASLGDTISAFSHQLEGFMNASKNGGASLPVETPAPIRPQDMTIRTVGAGAAALGAVALGAVALGAVVLGVLAIGKLAIGRLALGRAKLHRGQVDGLRIGRLIIEELRVERVTTPTTED
jgi:hypothetical protein